MDQYIIGLQRIHTYDLHEKQKQIDNLIKVIHDLSTHDKETTNVLINNCLIKH